MAKHYIATINALGDTRTEFDTNDATSLAVAREVWNEIKRKGGEVFRASPNGEGGERLHEFDPDADMLGIPKIVGG